MYENIDYDSLRKDLIDYFGTASSFNPMALIDLSRVENASNNELILIAIQNNFNLSNYNILTKTYKHSRDLY